MQLEGLKTYLVVAIAILSALLGFAVEQITLLQALQAIGLALGIGGNRSVVKVAEAATNAYRSDPERDPRLRILVTYAGVALTILTALLAGLNGEQPAAITISAILGALGLNFLGLGAKKAAEPVT